MSSKKANKPAKAEEDETTIKIPNTMKKKCEFNGIVVVKGLKQKIDDAVENGKLEALQMWGEIGPICCRAFMECLIDLNYQHLKKIRLWKADLEDEGVRSICNYIQKCNTIEYLDLMQNNITSLGCEFLSKVMCNPINKITKLKLDNNMIGDKGLAELTNGLRQNDRIQKISLNYCNITKAGTKYIQEILANIDSRLRTLKLQGNPLGNQGFLEIIRAVNSCGDKLQKLNLADTGLNLLSYDENQEYIDTIQQNIIRELREVIETNKTIAKYSFKNNYISNRVASIILEEVRENKNIFIIDLPQCIDFSLKEMHVQIMKKRKPKKKKAKKTGKGKK